MKINVTRPSMPDFDEYINEISSLWHNCHITNNGVKKQELERLICKYLDVEYVSLFVNGHTALEYLIMATCSQGEIITTPFTFASTTNAIVRCGLKPVFCDINRNNLTIDENKVEDLITENTRAILAVHVFGNMCNVERLEEIGKKYGIPVIYDGAHAFGVKKNGASAACFGEGVMYSFHATKVFNTIEGGCVASNNRELVNRLNVMQNFGLDEAGDCQFAGGNGKMNEFQAAMGICNLRHIDKEIEKRKEICKIYTEGLSKIKGITMVQGGSETEKNYSYMPVIVENAPCTRDELCNMLEKEGIYARKYFHPITSEMSCHKEKYCSNTQVAKEISEKIITLPLYSDLLPVEAEKIIEIIKNIFEKGRNI